MLAAVIHLPLFPPKFVCYSNQGLLPAQNMQSQRGVRKTSACQWALGNLYVGRSGTTRPIQPQFCCKLYVHEFSQNHRLHQDQLLPGTGPQTPTINHAHLGSSDMSTTVFPEMCSRRWLKYNACARMGQGRGSQPASSHPR